MMLIDIKTPDVQPLNGARVTIVILVADQYSEAHFSCFPIS